MGDTRPARLKELQLAREFDTSQAPVREALRELEATGVIESEPQRGSRVRTVSEKELGEAYQVRAVLEQFAGELTDRQRWRIRISRLYARRRVKMNGAWRAGRRRRRIRR